MTRNRCKIARENAGLSVGQAVKLLSIDGDVARHVERDTLTSHDRNTGRQAERIAKVRAADDSK